MIRTIENDFEYQMMGIFRDMHEEYLDEMKYLADDKEETKTFADWLWSKNKDIGSAVYEALDSWCGIDDFTKDLNFKD